MDPLTLGMLGTAGAQAIGGLTQGITGYLAAKDQLKAAKQAQGAITNAYGQATGYQQPFYNAGQQGLQQLQNGNYETATPGIYQNGEQQPMYQAPEFNFQQDPGYQFQLQQGQQAALGSAAGRGAGLSGSTLKALAKYGTGLADQSYGNAFDRYMRGRTQGYQEYTGNLGQYNKNRDFGSGEAQQDYLNRATETAGRYGRAQDLANYGERAGTNLSNLATDYGGNLAGLYGAQGNIRSAGTQAVGQAVGSTLGNMANTGLDYLTMGSLLNGGGLGGKKFTPQESAAKAFEKTLYGKAYNGMGTSAGLRKY